METAALLLPGGGVDSEAVNKLLLQRLSARRSRNFQEADRLREVLRTVGVNIDDASQTWRASDGTTGSFGPGAPSRGTPPPGAAGGGAAPQPGVGGLGASPMLFPGVQNPLAAGAPDLMPLVASLMAAGGGMGMGAMGLGMGAAPLGMGMGMGMGMPMLGVPAFAPAGLMQPQQPADLSAAMALLKKSSEGTTDFSQLDPNSDAAPADTGATDGEGGGGGGASGGDAEASGEEAPSGAPRRAPSPAENLPPASFGGAGLVAERPRPGSYPEKDEQYVAEQDRLRQEAMARDYQNFMDDRHPPSRWGPNPRSRPPPRRPRSRSASPERRRSGGGGGEYQFIKRRRRSSSRSRSKSRSREKAEKKKKKKKKKKARSSSGST
eukprot:TRINITY_DN12852_c4_g1_i1.p1 TRINITY_DN12852_c4_g1~~TRINITY_DN12852_c4_g1_i1.p1  ORF type:complete len:411 (+),score=112.08 TRINITY_DN12852_c4_g1_i1:98-1234(+)